jgi:small-conductance mechanosensitive channel
MQDTIKAAIAELSQWLATQLTSESTLVQLAIVATSLLLAWVLVRPVRSVVDHFFDGRTETARTRRFATLIRRLVFPAMWLALVGIGAVAIQDTGYGALITRAASSLLAAWLGIRVVSSAIAEPFWAHAAAITAWSIAALNILDLLNPALSFLDGLAFSMGESHVSVLSVIKAAFMVSVLLYCALAISRSVQSRIAHVPNLTPSIQVLLTQVTRFALVVAAFLISMSAVGIDLSTFAVVGGAIGLGIGFGLQKVVSNLISGIILLLDRSIKPGDVIEVGETYGTVDSLGARCTSVITRDGTEWLIPNEDLITQRVANWSYSTKLIRRRVPIGIAYDSDIDLATALILEAASETERVLKDPVTKCLLKGFGDNSVDLELRYWINDPEDGISSVTDAVLRKVWKKFQEHHIEIPFPQRDLHIRSDLIRVKLEPPDAS